MVKRLIGSDTTGGDGSVSIPYTGTGAGVVNLQVETEIDGSIVSETFSVLDCITTTNDKSIWGASSNIAMENVTNGVNFKGTSGTQRIWLTNNSQELFLPYTDDWIIEFDLVTPNLFAFYFTQATGSETGAVYCSQNEQFDTTVHIKMVYSSSNHTIKHYIGETLKNTMNTSAFANNIGFKMIDWQGDADITVSNLKVYLA